jgi:hypothetical protein
MEILPGVNVEQLPSPQGLRYAVAVVEARHLLMPSLGVDAHQNGRLAKEPSAVRACPIKESRSVFDSSRDSSAMYGRHCNPNSYIHSARQTLGDPADALPELTDQKLSTAAKYSNTPTVQHVGLHVNAFWPA